MPNEGERRGAAGEMCTAGPIRELGCLFSLKAMRFVLTLKGNVPKNV